MRDPASEPMMFFGPVSEAESVTLRDYLMADDFWSLRVGDSLQRFLKHEITPREFSYEIQVLAETCADRLWGRDRPPGDCF